MNARRLVLALATTLSACLRCRTLIGTYFCFAALCGLIALSLCCAVLAILQHSSSMCSLSACLRCHPLISTYLLRSFVRADRAVLCYAVLCCAVLAVEARRRRAHTLAKKKAHESKHMVGNMALFPRVLIASRGVTWYLRTSYDKDYTCISFVRI